MSVLPAWASFPNPVNEKAARVVAGGVVLLGVATAATASPWLAGLLTLGFGARVLAGPRFSLLGRLATEVIAPRLGMPRFVAGPPKRFAQAIGLAFGGATTVLLTTGLTTAGVAVVGVLVVFAFCESVLGFCAGCWVFGQGVRLGLVPAEICAECADISLRYRRTAV